MCKDCKYCIVIHIDQEKRPDLQPIMYYYKYLGDKIGWLMDKDGNFAMTGCLYRESIEAN